MLITTTGEAPGTNRLEISGTKGKLLCEGDKLFWTKNEVDSQEWARTCAVGYEKPPRTKIEVETENLEMVQQALDAKADIIMLDNMSNEEMTEAVKLVAGRALTEASGNVTEDRIVEIAKTGVDIISIGCITHSVPAMDISLRFY